MSDTKDYLQKLMTRYTTENVDDPVAFEKRIREFLELDDWKMEGYTTPEHQRDKSVKFHWGHNHDFGAFQLEGVLGDRHIDLLTAFIDHLGLPKDLSYKKVLDIGVWCGGTTMLLSAMGCDYVQGIEEVSKYAMCADFLSKTFGSGLYWGVKPWSLYDPVAWQYHYIIFPGVLYHLTDPILALRILFNALKDGGKLFLESLILSTNYNGAEIKFAAGKGWNWFIPSRSALEKMLECVGFEDINYYETEFGRGSFVATRTEWRDMLRAGLSRRDIR